jgi:hypothetical protein
MNRIKALFPCLALGLATLAYAGVGAQTTQQTQTPGGGAAHASCCAGCAAKASARHAADAQHTGQTARAKPDGESCCADGADCCKTGGSCCSMHKTSAEGRARVAAQGSCPSCKMGARHAAQSAEGKDNHDADCCKMHGAGQEHQADAAAHGDAATHGQTTHASGDDCCAKSAGCCAGGECAAGDSCCAGGGSCCAAKSAKK